MKTLPLLSSPAALALAVVVWFHGPAAFAGLGGWWKGQAKMAMNNERAEIVTQTQHLVRNSGIPIDSTRLGGEVVVYNLDPRTGDTISLVRMQMTKKGWKTIEVARRGVFYVKDGKIDRRQPARMAVQELRDLRHYDFRLKQQVISARV